MYMWSNRIKDFFELLREKAIKLCPDHPNINTDMDAFTHLHAITASLEGTTKACDDWHEFTKFLANQYKFDLKEACDLYYKQKRNNV